MDKLEKLAPLADKFGVAVVVLGVVVWWLMRRDEKRTERLSEQIGKLLTVLEVQSKTLEVLRHVDDRIHNLVLLFTAFAAKMKVDVLELGGTILRSTPGPAVPPKVDKPAPAPAEKEG